MNDSRAFGAYLASLLLFGTNGVVAAGITGLSSMQTVLLRTLLGSVVLIAAVMLHRKSASVLRDRRRTALIALSGVCMGASWMLQYEAYREIGSARPR